VTVVNVAGHKLCYGSCPHACPYCIAEEDKEHFTLLH